MIIICNLLRLIIELCYRLLHFAFCISIEMAETDEFNVEDQLNYEAETGEGGEGEVSPSMQCFANLFFVENIDYRTYVEFPALYSEY